jgi:hypothetical protein
MDVLLTVVEIMVMGKAKKYCIIFFPESMHSHEKKQEETDVQRKSRQWLSTQKQSWIQA